jgi:hypothetical protein
MNMSTNRGRHCIRLLIIGPGETELFQRFQYLTVPLSAVPELMQLAAARAAGKEGQP